MSIDVLTAPLSRVPLLSDLKPHQLLEIAQRSERLVFRPGDFIIEEGVVGDGAVLLVTGDAMRVSGPQLPNRTEMVPPGSLLGEMAMLIEIEHTSTVLARNPVRALRLLRSEMLDLMSRDAELADCFVQAIAGRLNVLANQLKAIDKALAPIYFEQNPVHHTTHGHGQSSAQPSIH